MKGSAKSETYATRAYGLSCAICRRMKIKCVNTGIQPNRCDRCIKLDKVCVFEPQKRRLARRDEHANRPYPPLESESTERQGREHTSSQPRQGQEPEVVSDACDGSFQPIDATQKVFKKEEDDDGFPTLSFLTRSEDTRTLTLDSALDPDRNLKSERKLKATEDADISSAKGSRSSKDDPISLRILNRPSAQMLFEGYFKHFEYHVGFLDPKLYTFTYTRATSAFLFTAILTTAARVFRPDVYPGLKAHQESLLGRTLLSCDAAQENIWAIVLGYYWKEMGDTRGYTLVGFAIRLATSSEWNVSRRGMSGARASPPSRRETEHQVRVRRDQERIWLFLGSLDRTLSVFTDRPLVTTLNETDVASRAWMSEAGNWTYSYGDVRAIAGLELTVLAKPVHDYLCSSRKSLQTDPEGLLSYDESELLTVMDTYNREMVTWADYWAPLFRAEETGLKCRASQVYLYRDHLRTYFHSILLHRVLAANDNNMKAPMAMAAAQVCYYTSLSLLQEAIKLGRDHDVLYYLWDTANLMIASSAMVLLKIVKQGPDIPGISVETAYEVFKGVAEVLTSAAGSLHEHNASSGETAHVKPAESTVEAQARLLRAIVLRVRVELLPHHPDRSRKTASPAAHESAEAESADADWSNIALDPGLMSHEAHQHSMASESWGGNQLPLDILGGEQHGFDADHLAYEMDFSLDASFIDSTFMASGFTAWEDPGMFNRPR